MEEGGCDIGGGGGSGGGGDGDAGVIGNGDTSRKTGFLTGSEGVGRVGDGI